MDYKIIGVMTGNSMDAVDVVLMDFKNGKMADVTEYSKPYTKELHDDFIEIRKAIRGFESPPAISMDDLKKMPLFQKAHDAYIQIVAETVNEFIQKEKLDKQSITAIGFHGQTLDHYPPSVAGADKNVYTLQVGSGQMLSNLTGIPVVYDFRSDDVMNGGEGAPLAPTHNKNIAFGLGFSEAIFFNAGNTSNIAVVSNETVMGWDAGPFNEFPDKIVRKNTNDVCDIDGKYGKKGEVDIHLLQELFDTSAVTSNGENFLNVKPPKSSDPSWYRLPSMFLEANEFETKLRTAEYFSAYAAAYTLQFVPQDLRMPTNFVLFGGGWNNPICKTSFEDILTGKGVVLLEHKDIFKSILERFDCTPSFEIIKLSKFMEARIFADLARYFLEEKTWFSKPIRAGHMPVILGTMRKPNEGKIDDTVNRAAKGWQG